MAKRDKKKNKIHQSFYEKMKNVIYNYLRKLIYAIKVNIIAGLIIITPVAITLLVIIFIVKSIAGILPIKKIEIILGITHSKFLAPVISLLMVISLIFLTGILIRSALGRRIYTVSNKILKRIPVIRTVYSSIKQISETFLSQPDYLFKKVVIVEFPQKDIFSIGFITSKLPDRMAEKLRTTNRSISDNEPVTVFIPTTPNPTTGFLIIIPRSKLTDIDMSYSEALSFIISAGTVDLAKSEPDITIIDRFETWLKGYQDKEK